MARCVGAEPPVGQAVYVCGCCMDQVSRVQLTWYDRDLKVPVCSGCAAPLIQAELMLFTQAGASVSQDSDVERGR